MEPMTGGHGDDYYYQLTSFIRRYKGTRPLPKASPIATIDFTRGFDQWKAVRPEYLDDVGDAINRDHSAWNNVKTYVNRSARNDFALLRVARDRKFLYFYAQTAAPISPSTDPNWMQLLIRTEDATAPSWLGYQFIVNRQSPTSNKAVLEGSLGGWNWHVVDKVVIRVQGNELEVAIPRADLGLADLTKPFRIQFKWSDNMQHPGDPNSFTLDGDAAPNERFNYRYETAGPDGQ
jgi:hypothetical protein